MGDWLDLEHHGSGRNGHGAGGVFGVNGRGGVVYDAILGRKAFWLGINAVLL